MEYVPPVNGDTGDPDRSYINANPGSGIEGSIPPAEAIEHPLREIVNVIEEAGLTPDGGDLTQLAQAIPLLTNAAGGLLDIQYFTSSGTWNKPAGMSASGFVEVIVVGGGGGGGGSGSSAGAGGAGGTSSFGSHCSATGGGSGVTGITGGSSAGNAVTGGTGSGGDLNLTGQGGGSPTDISATGIGGTGGGTIFGPGGKRIIADNNGRAGEAGPGFGCGGSGAGTIQNGLMAAGGGGGGSSIKKIAAASLGSTETVTVGAGGAAGTAGGSGGAAGGAGKAGIVIVRSYR